MCSPPALMSMAVPPWAYAVQSVPAVHEPRVCEGRPVGRRDPGRPAQCACQPRAFDIAVWCSHHSRRAMHQARKKANFKSILDKLQAHRDSQFDITLYFGYVAGHGAGACAPTSWASRVCAWLWVDECTCGWLAGCGSSFSKRGKYQRQGKLFSVTTSAAEIWASHTQGTPVRATAGLQGAGRASAGGNSHATKAEAKLSASP